MPLLLHLAQLESGKESFGSSVPSPQSAFLEVGGELGYTNVFGLDLFFGFVPFWVFPPLYFYGGAPLVSCNSLIDFCLYNFRTDKVP